METRRVPAHAPRVQEMQRRVMEVGPCLGCTDCRGLCASLLEVLSLPEAVLSNAR